jgi:hypothetical protein
VLPAPKSVALLVAPPDVAAELSLLFLLPPGPPHELNARKTPHKKTTPGSNFNLNLFISDCFNSLYHIIVMRVFVFYAFQYIGILQMGLSWMTATVAEVFC